jgi:hypothetical protein
VSSLLRTHKSGGYAARGSTFSSSERLFLREVDDGYIRIHRLLQDYFASHYPEPDGAAHQEASV